MNEDLEYAKTIYKIYQYFHSDKCKEHFYLLEEHDNNRYYRKDLDARGLCIFEDRSNYSEAPYSTYSLNLNYYTHTPNSIMAYCYTTNNGQFITNELLSSEECLNLTEESYFQYSTIFSKNEMRGIVLYHYLQSKNCSAFYFDLDFYDRVLHYIREVE